MKAISLWQPWATAMALRRKTIETRSWPTSYRGWLAIHAAKRKPDAVPSVFGDVPLGAVVCIVRLVACVRTESVGFDAFGPEEESWGDYERGRWAWITDTLIALPQPIPLRGHQGLFDWEPPPEIAALIQK